MTALPSPPSDTDIISGSPLNVPGPRGPQSPHLLISVAPGGRGGSPFPFLPRQQAVSGMSLLFFFVIRSWLQKGTSGQERKEEAARTLSLAKREMAAEEFSDGRPHNKPASVRRLRGLHSAPGPVGIPRRSRPFIHPFAALSSVFCSGGGLAFPGQKEGDREGEAPLLFLPH